MAGIPYNHSPVIPKMIVATEDAKIHVIQTNYGSSSQSSIFQQVLLFVPFHIVLPHWSPRSRDSHGHLAGLVLLADVQSGWRCAFVVSQRASVCRSGCVLFFTSLSTPFLDVPCGVFGSVTETPCSSVEDWMRVCICIPREKRLRGEWSHIIVAV